MSTATTIKEESQNQTEKQTQNSNTTGDSKVDNNSKVEDETEPIVVEETTDTDNKPRYVGSQLTESEEEDENIIQLTPEEEEKLRREFGLIASIFKKNLSIIIQEVTFPNDPRGDLIIDHSFKPELDENGSLKEVQYSLLFWKSGLKHRRNIAPQHAVMIVLNLLENHEITPQFMYDCGQNIKVAYGQLPAHMWAFAMLISRLEDMDFDETVPDESELGTRKRYRENYMKYVDHFRKIARDTIESKGREVPTFSEPEDSYEVSEDSADDEYDQMFVKQNSNKQSNKQSKTTPSFNTTNPHYATGDSGTGSGAQKNNGVTTINSTTINNTRMDEAEVSTKAVNTAKKRGRPKGVGNKPKSVTTPANSKNNNTASKATKKRGRPPKKTSKK